MKEKPIIETVGIGKRYDITRQRGGYITLRDVLMNILKKPFSFLKSKVLNAVGLSRKEEFWALRDISFEINRGEIIGIIGPNGAGKSTLLKILSQITPPTEGEIKIRGRVGSLLEVGTGFHPELTGRENIFLNGAILGMAQKEVAKKFDAIVAFAGIEQFLDTPVKYYSSGMYVRLAFSVAAHMEPDILIVDEVLAVGDAEFQKKCLGKMDDITREEGRTILFVSHNLDAIQRLCSKTILLKKGKIQKFGETSEVIANYLESDKTLNSVTEFIEKKDKDAQIRKISILDSKNNPQSRIPVGEKFYIEINFDVRKKLEKKLVMINFNYQGELLLFSTEGDDGSGYRDYEPGSYTTTVEIPENLFQVGTLSLLISIKHVMDGKSSIDSVKDINFDITSDKNTRHHVTGDNHFGKISTILKYKTSKTS